MPRSARGHCVPSAIRVPARDSFLKECGSSGEQRATPTNVGRGQKLRSRTPIFAFAKEMRFFRVCTMSHGATRLWTGGTGTLRIPDSRSDSCFADLRRSSLWMPTPPSERRTRPGTPRAIERRALESILPDEARMWLGSLGSDAAMRFRTLEPVDADFPNALVGVLERTYADELDGVIESMRPMALALLVGACRRRWRTISRVTSRQRRIVERERVPISDASRSHVP